MTQKLYLSIRVVQSENLITACKEITNGEANFNDNHILSDLVLVLNPTLEKEILNAIKNS